MLKRIILLICLNLILFKHVEARHFFKGFNNSYNGRFNKSNYGITYCFKLQKVLVNKNKIVFYSFLNGADEQRGEEFHLLLNDSPYYIVCFKLVYKFKY